MSDVRNESAGGDTPAGDLVATTTYDLLKERLRAVAEQVLSAANALNERRVAAFASQPLRLAEQDRVNTELAATPRDMVCVGDLLLLGVNPAPGLASKRAVGDVFTLHGVTRVGETSWDFTAVADDDPDWFLRDPSFVRDFDEIYRYYAEARLLTVEIVRDELLMVFGIGTGESDVRALRWRMPGRGETIPTYLDAYGEQDRRSSRRYDFTWTEAGRELVVDGRWPHYNLDQLLFVGALRGRLEIRIDDAVDGGRTILAEDLSEREADVAELRISFANLGELILLRVLPYRENAERFYVYNRLSREIQRVDAIGRGCHQLPEGQGIVFPGGYHLQSGESHVFATDASGFELIASRHAPNGEDILYVYERPSDSAELLCAYNVVSRTMDVPVGCHGYALFDDGVMVTVRASVEPQRVHTIAVHTSPFCLPDRYSPAVSSDSFLGRVGNPTLVHALGETMSLARDAADPPFNRIVFETLVARTNRILDSSAWLNEPEADGLGAQLVALRKAAGSVLDEFAAVVEARKSAALQTRDAELKVNDFVASADLDPRDTAAFIGLLSSAKTLLGDLSRLGELRSVDHDAVAGLQAKVEERFARLGQGALTRLAPADSLQTITDRLRAHESAGVSAKTAAEVAKLAGSVDEAGQQLGVLVGVVSGVEAEDPTLKTTVLQRLSDALALRNGVRASLDARSATLRTSESADAFAASMSVVSQRSVAAVASTSTAADCDDVLSELSAELENLDLRFGSVPQFGDAIAAKRDELTETLLRRREALAAERTQQVERLVGSVERVLATIQTRASALADRAAVDGFFATDPLVTRVKRSAAELRSLGEEGRASELEVALASAREAATRAVGDRSELFEAGNVRIGSWKIGVNREPFELRLGASAAAGGAAGGFELRLTGTELTMPITDDDLAGYVDLAGTFYASESDDLARAVFLAFDAYASGVTDGGVTAFASARLEDGYELGVHDVDAAAILAAARATLDRRGLRSAGTVRAVAAWWLHSLDRERRTSVERSLVALRSLGAAPATRTAFLRAQNESVDVVATGAGLDVSVDDVLDALLDSGERFQLTVSAEGAAAGEALVRWTGEHRLDCRAAGYAELIRWARDLAPAASADSAAEAALIASGIDVAIDRLASVTLTVRGLRSAHKTIVDGALSLHVPTAWTAYRHLAGEGKRRFAEFSQHRRRVLDEWRAKIGPDALRPKVLSTFVRNRLVDEVYLPLIGDNLARQIGLNGAAQGLLLLVSPPGYGKTTLVEYVCDLLGFALVRINGPALGKHVTSLDPGVAPDAASAEELVKLNRAFAMATNVVCYLDDVQHTSPELLQKFIPLCDATRRIEGVFEGHPRTYDLVGKRFVMVMAGNPYSSDGTRFRIPDMLANRADVHNLGDVADRSADAFAQSYVENACGVNEILRPVLARGRSDLRVLLDAAGGAPMRSDQLSYAYSGSELTQITSTLRNLLRARDALLAVNREYIRSATLDDAMRGEPPFLLQGSYRNMARLARRIVGAMTPDEVDRSVDEYYRAESQTLGTSAAWNLAKLHTVLGRRSDDADLAALRSRWRDAKTGDNPLVDIASALRGIRTGIEAALDDGPTGRRFDG